MAKLLLVAGLIASAAAAFTADALNVKSAVKPHPNHLVFEKAVEAEKKEKGPASDGYWTDLFAPPYGDCPSVMVSLSCMNTTTCYVPAGVDGVGFGVMSFDGQPGGKFVPMEMKSSPMMLMAIGVGGDKNAPAGAVGGMGFGNAIQFLQSNGGRQSWVPSNLTADAPSFFPTQCIRASADGQRVLSVIADGGASSGVLYSVNAGRNFTFYGIDPSTYVSSGTGLRYAAMPSESTWFVTAGNWPSSAVEGDQIFNSPTHAKLSGANTNAFALNERVAMVRCPHTGKVIQKVRDMAAKTAKKDAAPPLPKSDTYSAQIFRTKDGGKTFKSVFEDLGTFYFNGIDCVDVSTCYAVGSGNGVAYIYGTKDGGNTWFQSFSTASEVNSHISLMSIAVSDNTVMAAGGGQVGSGYESYVITTEDGVKWTKQAGLPGIGDIGTISLLPGGYGFGAAVTIYQASTILALRPQGSPTLPPPPTQATFSQKNCDDAACSENCQTVSFPQNKCLRVSSGGTALVRCSLETNALVQTFFPKSQACAGNSTSKSMPLNQCLASSNGGYFENIC